MKLMNIIAAGIAGTTAMTAFSYYASKAKHKNFREPHLLGKVAESALPEIEKSNANISGWITHYATGILFAALYSSILEINKKKPTFYRGLIVGGLTGIPAVLVWKTTLRLFPVKTPVNKKRYFGHLLLAHIIFGGFTYLFLKKKNCKL